MARKVALLVCAAWVLLVCACGYRFQGAGKLPGNIANVFIEGFENRTGETGLETTVTNAVIFEFTKRNKAALAQAAAGADAVMRGAIHSLNLQTVSARKKDLAGERRVTLSVDVQLVQADGKVLWAAKGVADNETFPVTDDKLLNERLQRQALATTAVRLAERVYNRLTDDF
jgi:outer membrane lipopolysaccharide assembly protein LptE/RlpB